MIDEELAKKHDALDKAFEEIVAKHIEYMNKDRPWWMFRKFELSRRELSTAKIFFMEGLLWEAQEMRKVWEGKDGRKE